MCATAIQLPRIKPGDDLAALTKRALQRARLTLHEDDLIAVASKIVSISEGRQRRIADIKVSAKARRLALWYAMREKLAEIVLQEADEILGGVRGFMLTVKDGIMTANAGVDLKNSPKGTVTLWPENADASAQRLRSALRAEGPKRLGVLVVDSRVTPMRLGTSGLAIGVSGFMPVLDHRGRMDLYGRSVKVTQTNVADDIASASHLLMGETDEQNGLVLVRGAHLEMNSQGDSDYAKLKMQSCLVTSNLQLMQ